MMKRLFFLQCIVLIKFMHIGFGYLEKNLYDYLEYTVNFTTPEADVMPPKIKDVILSEDKGFVSVDWILNQICPGYIRRYELIISCDAGKAIIPRNLSFDCRNISQGPLLYEAVPKKCKGEDIYVKVRDLISNRYYKSDLCYSVLIAIAYVI